MGLKKYNILELFDKSPIITSKMIKKRIKNDYYKLLIKNLLDKKEIFRVSKGNYSKFDDPSLFVFTVKPAYLGLHDAMSIHNIWEQETCSVILTVKKVRVGLRKTDCGNVIIKNIKNKYLFGIVYIEFENFYLPYSDIEKTLIDMVYYNEYLDKKVINKFKSKMDMKKFNKYLLKYPVVFQNKVKRII